MKRTLLTIIAVLPLFSFAQSYTDDNNTAVGGLILFLKTRRTNPATPEHLQFTGRK